MARALVRVVQHLLRGARGRARQRRGAGAHGPGHGHVLDRPDRPTQIDRRATAARSPSAPTRPARSTWPARTPRWPPTARSATRRRSPQILDRDGQPLTDADGEPVVDTGDNCTPEAIPPGVATTLNQMLVGDVEPGRHRPDGARAIPGHEIAGKTGTTQDELLGRVRRLHARSTRPASWCSTPSGTRTSAATAAASRRHDLARRDGADPRRPAERALPARRSARAGGQHQGRPRLRWRERLRGDAAGGRLPHDRRRGRQRPGGRRRRRHQPGGRLPRGARPGDRHPGEQRLRLRRADAHAHAHDQPRRRTTAASPAAADVPATATAGTTAADPAEAASPAGGGPPRPPDRPRPGRRRRRWPRP